MTARGRLLSFVGDVDTTTQQAAEGRLLEVHPSPWVASRPAAGEDLAERFRRELEALGGEWLDTAELGIEAVLAPWLRSLAEGLGRPLRVVVDPQLLTASSPVFDVLKSVAAGVLAVLPAVVPGTCGDGVPGTCATTAELAAADLGISLVDLAIAETGTLVERPRPGRPRALSLLPPHHLAVLPRCRLVAGLEDLFDHIDALEGDSEADDAFGAYFTWISGPSRTADIEKVLTVGVHGPGRLTVLWLDDALPAS